MSLRLTYGVKMSEITNNSTGAGFNKGAAICAYVCLFLAMCSGIAGWLFLAIIPAIVFIVMLYKAGDGVSHDHAVYSRNTIFAYIAAIIGIIVVWVAVLALIGSNAADEEFVESLKAVISAGTASKAEILDMIMSSAIFMKIAAATVISLAIMLWPMHRAVLGIIRAAQSVPVAGCGIGMHLAAVAVVIVIYAILYCIL